MSTDYEAIRKENFSRHGWDISPLDTMINSLFSQRTHFLFELIQNAEDAGATELTFELFDDRLEVRHNGHRFNKNNVVGICAWGRSTKLDDLTQIGKFGIGFKSVYAYTRTPCVHSDDEHFRIENYLHPYATTEVEMNPNETRFVLPFNRPDMPATKATSEIAKALKNMELGTLLFLRSIQRVRICGNFTAERVLNRRDVGPLVSSRHVVLTSSGSGSDGTEDWLIWHRSLDTLGSPRQLVEIAFRVTEQGGVHQLKEQEASPLVVFFPTAKETFLGFLVQGPYTTTLARDNIPEDDEWNRKLAAATSQLLLTILRELRDKNLLTVDVLEAMPLDASRFKEESLFRPLFEITRDALANEQLVPSAEGGYCAAKELKLARGTGLRDLLSGDQLGRLYGDVSCRGFAQEYITSDRSPKLYEYLRSEIGLDEVTPETVVTHSSDDFLKDQTDDWIARFYGFLHANPALWRAPRLQGGRGGLVRSKPILRLEDGTHVTPFDSRGLPNAYLPGLLPTDFRTVRQSIASDPVARKFLEALGFTEPDIVAEVRENVLPRYVRANIGDVDSEQHHADIERIVRALSEAGRDRRTHLREELRSTAFLVGVNAGTGERQFRKPPSLYERTEDLEVYLDGNENAWFVDEELTFMPAELRDLGVRTKPIVVARSSDQLGYVVIADVPYGPHERGLDGFDPDAKIDGLNHALRNPSDARSRYVWNVLMVPNHHLLKGTIERSTRQNFVGSHREERQSPIGQTASNSAWLPGSDGAFHRPADLSLNDLPDGYRRDEVLAEALGMERPIVEEASRLLGWSSDLVRGLQKYLQKYDDLQEILSREIATRERGHEGHPGEGSDPEPSDQATKVIDYHTELEDVFSRQDRPQRETDVPGPDRVNGDVRNPARREAVRESITDDRASEPAAEQRFTRAPRRVWESQDSSVRHFLLEQYQGRCQVCSETFTKRDGTPYFEGVYLVSRVRGRWLDRPGNVLCLCATCSAKFQHGSVEADDIVDQILRWRTRLEGGADSSLTLRLCGDDVELRFKEKHLLELQEMLRSDSE